METLSVLCKTKGGHREGMGDVTSSVSLARELRSRGCRASFIVNDNKNVADLVLANGFTYTIAEDGEDLAGHLSGGPFDIVILNQMNTHEAEARLWRDAAPIMVTVEDTGQAAGLADIRFNVLYPIAGAITGFEYIPLSDAFRSEHASARVTQEDVTSVLVAQGGSDTYGFIPMIVRSLYGLPGAIVVNVVIGPNFRHDSALSLALEGSPRRFNIIRGRRDLSDIMLDSGAAVSAGGNTLFELACLGVPTVVVCAEPFETATADRMQDAGFGINLGFGKSVTEDAVYSSLSALIGDRALRSAMSAKGASLVDGGGAGRMADTVICAAHKRLEREK